MNEFNGENRRKGYRRKRDRVESYIQRGALLLLVVLYFVGFKTISDQTDDIAAIQKSSDAGRQNVVQVVCDVDNKQNRALRVLIINSTKQSKPFNAIYERLGLPSYAERLKTAIKLAQPFQALDCGELLDLANANK